MWVLSTIKVGWKLYSVWTEPMLFWPVPVSPFAWPKLTSCLQSPALRLAYKTGARLFCNTLHTTHISQTLFWDTIQQHNHARFWFYIAYGYILSQALVHTLYYRTFHSENLTQSDAQALMGQRYELIRWNDNNFSLEKFVLRTDLKISSWLKKIPVKQDQTIGKSMT